MQNICGKAGFENPIVDHLLFFILTNDKKQAVYSNVAISGQKSES